MTITTLRRTLVGIGLLLAPAASLAQEARGTWLVQERDARVRISPCGDALCGWISWLKDSSAADQIGRRVLWDMKTQGDGIWKGKVFNPRDGNTYSGKMHVSGDALAMTGCVFGGAICRTFSWERIK
jgi:uncharacterized protein (DUF2147 family)